MREKRYYIPRTGVVTGNSERRTTVKTKLIRPHSKDCCMAKFNPKLEPWYFTGRAVLRDTIGRKGGMWIWQVLRCPDSACNAEAVVMDESLLPAITESLAKDPRALRCSKTRR